MDKAPPLTAHARKHIRDQKRILDEAHRLLKKGIVDDRLRKSLSAAGISFDILKNLHKVTTKDRAIVEKLLLHEWERLHDHSREFFDTTQVDKLFDELD